VDAAAARAGRDQGLAVHDDGAHGVELLAGGSDAYLPVVAVGRVPQADEGVVADGRQMRLAGDGDLADRPDGAGVAFQHAAFRPARHVGPGRPVRQATPVGEGAAEPLELRGHAEQGGPFRRSRGDRVRGQAQDPGPGPAFGSDRVLGELGQARQIGVQQERVVGQQRVDQAGPVRVRRQGPQQVGVDVAPAAAAAVSQKVQRQGAFVVLPPAAGVPVAQQGVVEGLVEQPVSGCAAVVAGLDQEVRGRRLGEHGEGVRRHGDLQRFEADPPQVHRHARGLGVGQGGQQRGGRHALDRLEAPQILGECFVDGGGEGERVRVDRDLVVHAVRAGDQAGDQEVAVGQRGDAFGHRGGDFAVGVRVAGPLVADQREGGGGVLLQVDLREVGRQVEVDQGGVRSERAHQAATVVPAAAADDHLGAEPRAGARDRQQQRRDDQPGLSRTGRLVQRVDDDVEPRSPAVLRQPSLQSRDKIIDGTRYPHRSGPGDLGRHVERGLALGVHRAGDEADRRPHVVVVRRERGHDSLVGGGDDPAEHGRLADARRPGDHQHVRIRPRALQPLHDLGQRRGPAPEAVAALGVPGDAAGAGTPVADRLHIAAERPAPRLQRAVPGRRDRPGGQLVQVLVREVPVDLVQGDRLRVAGVRPARLGLPDQADHGVEVPRPQAGAAEPLADRVPRSRLQLHPPVRQRHAHIAVRVPAPIRVARKAERPPLVAAQRGRPR
jgi:hypothetical protein